MTSTLDYAALGLQKRSQRDNIIPKDWKLKDFPATDNVIDVPQSCGLLSERELDITSTNDAVDIVRKIRERQYTAEEVTRAFCKRAAIAQQLTNCLTEIFFDEAIARAQELDKEQSTATTDLRPLHGLPISLKDSFRIPGVASSIGLVCFAAQADDTYSALPKLLLDLGAVLYCKTNVPQTMMTADSENNVFGRTLNPWNKKLTAGGSSGGEGALVAMRGSVLGIGTDIAGSIRIPSICDGVYGFKPSANIIPYGGQRSPAMAGLPGIIPVAGPLATSMRACNFFLKTIIEAEPWRYDPMCFHQHWRGTSLKRTPLRVGVAMEDGMHTPWPPVRRAMAVATKKLEQAGVELVPIELPAMLEAVVTTFGMFGLDGGKFVQDLITQGSEPLVESVKKVNLVGGQVIEFDKLCELNVTRAKIQQIYHSLWLNNKLDAIIMPPAPTTATPHDMWDSAAYTALWNLLDYPAVVVPAGHVAEDDHADGIENATHGEQDQRNYKVYTGPADFVNVPLAVQVVGMRQEDEHLALIAAYVDQVINA